MIVENRYDHPAAPTDEPGFGDQWYHHNTGQTGGRPDADIDSPTAWESTLGAGVMVAVIDSGVELCHPDLRPRSGRTTTRPGAETRMAVGFWTTPRMGLHQR